MSQMEDDMVWRRIGRTCVLGYCLERWPSIGVFRVCISALLAKQCSNGLLEGLVLLWCNNGSDLCINCAYVW